MGLWGFYTTLTNLCTRPLKDIQSRHRLDLHLNERLPIVPCAAPLHSTFPCFEWHVQNHPMWIALPPWLFLQKDEPTLPRDKEVLTRKVCVERYLGLEFLSQIQPVWAAENTKIIGELTSSSGAKFESNYRHSITAYNLISIYRGTYRYNLPIT